MYGANIVSKMTGGRYAYDYNEYLNDQISFTIITKDWIEKDKDIFKTAKERIENIL